MPDLFITANAVIVRQTGLEENRLVVIRLKDTIAATDGDALDTEYSSYFSTHYDPLYASANRIRTEIGRFIGDIPDDTINQLAWKWSTRADILRTTGIDTDTYYGIGASNSDLLSIIYSDYVTNKVIVDLLSASPDDAGFQKSLADLRVQRSSGALRNALNKAMMTAAKLEEAIKQGGFLGVRAQGTIKGLLESDRPTFGRLWTSGEIPSVNTRIKSESGRRGYSTFRGLTYRGAYRGTF